MVVISLSNLWGLHSRKLKKVCFSLIFTTFDVFYLSVSDFKQNMCDFSTNSDSIDKRWEAHVSLYLLHTSCLVLCLTEIVAYICSSDAIISGFAADLQERWLESPKVMFLTRKNGCEFSKSNIKEPKKQLIKRFYGISRLLDCIWRCFRGWKKWFCGLLWGFRVICLWMLILGMANTFIGLYEGMTRYGFLHRWILTPIFFFLMTFLHFYDTFKFCPFWFPAVIILIAEKPSWSLDTRQTTNGKTQ